MLTSLSIGNFKCFNKTQKFQLNKLNVLAGYNGRGKSSVFQAFLLLAQSFYIHGDVKTLDVNGELVSLDKWEDLINGEEENKRSPVCMTLQSDIEEVEKVKLGYTAKAEQERQGNLVDLKVTSNGVEKDYSLNEVASFEKGSKTQKISDRTVSAYPEVINKLFEEVRFVSADRQGPTLFEKKHDLSPHNPAGKNGEYILNVIASYDDKTRENINQSLSYIMDGGEILLEGATDKNNPVLSLNFKIGNKTQKEYKAINCGYGYSYILSIIVNAITMKNGMLFIENPEAHLHPKAQSYLTRFLCKQLANKNIQIFIETHSEHILNAVRLCTLKDENEYEITHKDVSIYFFDKDFSCEKLEIDKNAQIANWPTGFFDQQELDLTEILKLGLFK